MEVVIAGSSGLIGTAVVAALDAAGHQPIRMLRDKPDASPEKPNNNVDTIHWDPEKGVIDHQSLDGVDAVINLCGAGIGAKRWTDDYKKTLLSSRTRTTSLLATTLAELPSPPRRFLSASAVGIYGDCGDEILTEESDSGSSFLATLADRWESSAQPAVDTGIGTTFLRTGIVLTPEGGALAKMLPFFKLGLGGKFGDGKQFMSWISLTDTVDAILHLLNSKVTGAANLTAPKPVTNAAFTDALGEALHRPTLLPVPKFGPRLLLGSELADALLFESIRAVPATLTEDGFEFSHDSVLEALTAELS